MGQFLERCYLQKHSQEKIDNMNRSESTKEIESIISNLLKQKAPGPDIFTSEYCQHLRKKLILYNLFQRIKAEGILL